MIARFQENACRHRLIGCTQRQARKPSWAGKHTKALALCLLFASTVMLPLQRLHAQITQPSLRKQVQEALDSKSVRVEEPVFDLKKDEITVSLGNAEIDRLDYRLLTYPTQLQFKVEMIRRYRSGPAQKKTWEPVLQRVEKIIEKELSLITTQEMAKKEDRLSADESNHLLEDYNEYAHRLLIAPLDRYAEEQGLVVRIRRKPGEVAPPGPFRHHVKLITDPLKAAVYYLPEFEYRLRQRAGQVENVLYWRECLGQELQLSGNYRFLIRWEDRAQSKLTGTVSITKDETITLRP